MNTLSIPPSAMAAREIWYRSGAAARIAGLPVETLRVWERRYGLSDTQRSEHGQRLYSAEQVQRLGLLKLLVDQGHPIGQLAQLGMDTLRQLAGAASAEDADGAHPIRLAVVSVGLARRIAASSGAEGQLQVAASWPRLEQVAGGAEADVLVVEASEPDETLAPAIAAARDALGGPAVAVLYRFCSNATIRALRSRGWLVARVPAEIGELASLCRAALKGVATPLRQGEAIAPRRFDEEALADITAAGNRLSCECPRHLAELLLMLGSFERYSQQCATRSKEDEQLHRDLQLAAGRARVVLESAMEQLARAEGLPLPDR